MLVTMAMGCGRSVDERPQPGISIKVTTWSDGTRTSEKIVR